MGAVPETTEIGSGAKRGVRAGVQAEGENEKVLTVRSRTPNADEKSLQAWVEDLLKIALAQDCKKEARERQNMGQEDSNSQRRRAWEKIWDPRVLALSPFLAAGN